MRANALDKIDTEIWGRKEELGALLSREEGKTLPEGIGEAGRAGAIFKFFAQECLRLRGDKLASVRPGLEVEVTREPVGVVGIIAPLEFSDRDSGVENRASSGKWQLRVDETR